MYCKDKYINYPIIEHLGIANPIEISVLIKVFRLKFILLLKINILSLSIYIYSIYCYVIVGCQKVLLFI